MKLAEKGMYCGNNVHPRHKVIMNQFLKLKQNQKLVSILVELRINLNTIKSPRNKFHSLVEEKIMFDVTQEKSHDFHN
jgi:hypothetical protein